MPFQITDAATAGAIKIQFSCRQNHSGKELEQLWHVRAHGYIICPGTGDKIEEFNQQMPRQRPSAVWRAFAEMPIGAVGIVPSTRVKNPHALVIRFTGSVIGGAAPGLRCSYGEDGDFSIIAPSNCTVAPLEHPFNCIYRHVEVLGEITDYVGCRSTWCRSKLWLLDVPVPVDEKELLLAEEAAAAAPAEPARKAKERLDDLEAAHLGVISTAATLVRLDNLERELFQRTFTDTPLERLERLEGF